MAKEAKFIPRPGQTDYTHIRYAPVVNCVVVRAGKVLLVQRSNGMRLYPAFWNGISGFLDDHKSIEEKVYEELYEELGLDKTAVLSIERGQVLLQEAPEYGKTWLVLPVRVSIGEAEIKTDWEAASAQWFEPKAVPKLDLLPGFIHVFAQFFGPTAPDRAAVNDADQ